ncbi:MAG TPA: RluA family pseudouridine synthase [Elusimicrobiota bacterium]|nr:RluA family pseudouridine synthase [Elusimicrobiota bacterium]
MSPPLRIVFEDGDVLAVCKPAGQAVIPGRGLIEEPLCLQARRRGGGKIFVVHRIDREASGVVVFAKNAPAHRRLCQDFESRRASKTYWAAVAGRPEDAGVIEKPLRLFGSGRMGAAAGGKASLTRYRTLERFPRAALVEACPMTGRHHQLRAHFFSTGCPILGDPLYGKPPRPVGGFPRLMLHALELSLPAPTAAPREAAPMIFRAEPDEDFSRLLARLRAGN